MISFKRKLLLILTTVIVVSFLLLGTLLYLALAKQFIDGDKAGLTKDAKIFESYVSGDKRVEDLIRDYEKSYHSSILILDKDQHVIYKTAGTSKNEFNQFITKYTLENNDKVNYRYDGSKEKSLPVLPNPG